MSLWLYIEAREPETHQCECSDCGNKHDVQITRAFFDRNITHNLIEMFDEAGVYEILWRGDGLVAGAQTDKLRAALREMEMEPERFKKHNPKNGWGNYEGAMEFLRSVIAACAEHPEGVFRCSR